MKKRRWLGTNEAANVLGLDPDTVVSGVKNGQIPAFEVSVGNGKRHRYRFDADELEHWLESRRTGDRRKRVEYL